MKKRKVKEKEDRELIIIGRPRRISDIGMETKERENKEKEKKLFEIKEKEEKPREFKEFKEIKEIKMPKTPQFYSDEKFQQAMIQNFILTQKVMTDLAEKLDSLSDQTSKLLALFEISAKSFIEKGSEGGKIVKEDKDLLDKIDRLMEQNKVIAKGLTMIEEKVRSRVEPEIIGPPNLNKPSGMGQIPQRG
jgi:hypothetical protein